MASCDLTRTLHQFSAGGDTQFHSPQQEVGHLAPEQNPSEPYQVTHWGDESHLEHRPVCDSPAMLKAPSNELSRSWATLTLNDCPVIHLTTQAG